MSVCVSNTTKLQKDYIFKMSFFLWLETGGFPETGKSLIVNVCLWAPLGKKEMVFEDDVFIENTCLVRGSKRRTKIYART